jgi:hypothetical protein
MQKIERSVRRRRYTKAWVSAEGITNLECSVIDVSDGGMKLVSALADKIPDTFTVRFNSTSPNNGLCQVIWRRPRSLGVKFVR